VKTLLQINSVVNWGSTGRIVEDIGKKAIKSGWRSYVAYGRFEGESQSQLIKIGTTLDSIIHGIYTRLFDMHGFASKKATIKLVKKIKKISPDLILLHNLHGYYINIQVLFDYLKEVKIPVVWTFHDCWPITGHCAYFDFCKCQRWKVACYCCPQKDTYPKSIFLDRSNINFEIKNKLFNSVNNMVLIPVSHWLSTILTESYLNKYPIKVIHNGIDVNTFSPQKQDDIIRQKYLIGNRFMILGVASVWSERKGLKDFIKLANILPVDYIIFLIGLNEIQKKNLPSQIIGIARTENTRELAAIYSAADLYVNPTWEDNFPTTNLEALACGTPIVTYRTGGSIEAVSTDSGFIVEKGDIIGLLNIANEVKMKKRKHFANACRDRAVALFDKDYCFSEYIELFENLT
jgi:putative colanic acid biosynthesis glycosyltransferase WcaC